MERGPMVLFGAIVAVGLGPAMWLGAQFGQVTVTPLTPPPAVIADSTPGKAAGGAGAAPEVLTADTGTDPVTELIPLSATPSARPSASAAGAVEAGSPDPTATPSRSSSATTRSTDPTTPSTESTTSPTTEPTPDDTEPTSPATLPPTEQQGTSAGGDASTPVV
jgi:hypothetical protein